MGLKGRIKGIIPPRLLDAVLLTFPFLYATRLVRYETNLVPQGGIDELLENLKATQDIAGDIIECGSSRCGGSAIMANWIKARGLNKKVYACDSFEGFDRDELALETAAGKTSAPATAFTSTSLEYVLKKLNRLGLNDIVMPVKGYFQDTLPGLDHQYSLALIDCDLKASMVYCATEIWPRLNRGGRLLFDDYTDPHFLGAREGVDEFVGLMGAEIAEHRLLGRLYLVVKS
ncbi:MAG: class I SAM-dependent methyltransferase [Candidatus Marinimicrobia bacterium]|nr:class I SAM-dependent methyltransferase [Candidatus Neomarinimicrobiota bacterium]